MIHKIYVNADTEPGELRKVVRKKLMTGGAVLRIAADASADELERIYGRFASIAEPNNLASQVLVQLCGHPSAPEPLLDRLRQAPLPEIQRALKQGARASVIASETADV